MILEYEIIAIAADGNDGRDNSRESDLGREQGNAMRFGSHLIALAAATVLSLPSYGAALAADGDADAGRVIAERQCARCHSIAATGASPEEKAPPFRTLKTKWPLENLEEAFAEGIVVGHIMPEFQFDPGDIRDLLAFLDGIPVDGGQ